MIPWRQISSGGGHFSNRHPEWKRWWWWWWGDIVFRGVDSLSANSYVTTTVSTATGRHCKMVEVSDWLIDLLSLKAPERSRREEGDKTTLRWFLVLKTINTSSHGLSNFDNQEREEAHRCWIMVTVTSMRQSRSFTLTNK